MRGCTNRKESNVHPFLSWSKIQEGFPAHCSDLPNKELGYDTLIDRGDGEPIKLRNCVCSARPNSELFKRFSRNLAQNIKREVDQLIIFTSLSARCRLQTSIGTAGNPGIFLMTGLTYLDEKYKEAYRRCEIQLSFLEFRDSQVYDLLCSTGQPLLSKTNAGSKRFEGFGEHWVKTSTFSQFIKYFKIALFNNKERDFGGQNQEGICRTSFVMRIRSSLYDTQNVLIRQQESTLVDYQLSPLRQKQKTGRTILDYFLIEANNCNPLSKQIHYHLVQQNPLLLLLKKFLPQRNSIPATSSQIIFLFSIPARKDLLDSSLVALEHIQTHINQQWELPFQGRVIRTARFDREAVKGQLEHILSGISLNTYTSLRAFNALRKWLSGQAKRCLSLLRQFRKLIVQYIRQQLQLQFLQNELVGYHFKLVGSCIKSDHFKDFYKAKSYLQLSREVSIKTEGTRQHILQKLTEIQNISRRFQALRAKELESVIKAEGLNHIQKPSEQAKFKKVGVTRPENQKYQLFALVKSLLDYVGRLWDLVCLQRPRTTRLCVKLQQEIFAEEQDLNALFHKFCIDIEALRETEVLYEQQNNQYNNNDVTLFRSLDFLGLIGNKKQAGQLNIGKRLLIKKQIRRQNSTNLMPHIQNDSLPKSRLPSIMKPLIISGDIRISNFIMTPLKTIQSQMHLEPDGHN